MRERGTGRREEGETRERRGGERAGPFENRLKSGHRASRAVVARARNRDTQVASIFLSSDIDAQRERERERERKREREEGQVRN